MSLWYKYLRGTTWDGSFVSVPFFHRMLADLRRKHGPSPGHTNLWQTLQKVVEHEAENPAGIVFRGLPLGSLFLQGELQLIKPTCSKRATEAMGGHSEHKLWRGTSYAKHHPLHRLLWCLWLKAMRKKHFVVWMRNGHSMWSHWFLKLICAATILINSQCYITSYFETQYLMTNISINIIYFFIKKWF